MTDIKLPPKPEPFTVASTMKCTACGADYEPARALAPNAAAANFAWRVPPHACKCGCTQFGGTVSYDSPSPAKYTDAHLEAFARAAVALNAIPDGWVAVPREPTLEMGWAYLEVAHKVSPHVDHSFSHSGYRAMLAATPTPATTAKPGESHE